MWFAAYRKAVGMLRSEFKENLYLAEKMRVNDEDNPSKDRFSTQACGASIGYTNLGPNGRGSFNRAPSDL